MPTAEGRRAERIAREQVLHVGDQELLMLLLVVQPQLDQVGRTARVPGLLEIDAELLVDASCSSAAMSRSSLLRKRR